MYLLEDMQVHLCEKFCGIWANTAAQIASEAPRIQAYTRACKSKHPMYKSLVHFLNAVFFLFCFVSVFSVAVKRLYLFKMCRTASPHKVNAAVADFLTPLLGSN